MSGCLFSVLPKFEVKINLPTFGTVANPELKGTVTAKYVSIELNN